MSLAWRFITLAAVSKDEQAIDRASIPSQLEITRATGERLGGTFVNQYVIDGYSRTAYYNLDDALADIPPLKECINAIGRSNPVPARVVSRARPRDGAVSSVAGGEDDCAS